ncbi:MAG: NAD-dependent DNA ligase LigA [Candidatus Omnitrophota bacterium]|jgi:DNA ligase (NAD+)
MENPNVKKEIESLREQIRDADRKYYVLSQPEISDKEYDDLLRHLKDFEEKYPQFLLSDSPTQRVSGGILEGFRTIKHEVKMLSLDNTYSVEEVKDWEVKIKRMLKSASQLHYVVEPKVDGVSCSLTYKSGRLISGATRGDGEVGEDVTANIRTIKSIPLRLLGQNIPDLLEVRGEIYMDKKELETINKNRLKNQEQLFANPRNAASGSLKLLSPSMVAERNLECYIHSFGLAKSVEFQTHKEFFEKIKSLGLRVNPHNKICANLDEAIDYCMEWQDKRDALSYEIDGMVIKVDDYRLREILGTTLKSPRWAVAYKFPAHQATTVVEEIEFGVGRTGAITPVAILKAVSCAGVTISRATLHNFDEIERLDVRETDTVLIERAGEVIPKIIKVITSKRNKHAKKVHVPKHCPVCKQPISKEKEEEVYWYCINPDCPAKIKQSLLHFSSRACMDIESMGESVVEELVNRGLVKSLADIYNLKKENLLKLPLFAEKKADNLITAIEASKKRPLSRLIFGLGIRHIGEKAAALLAAKFSNMDKLFTLKPADLEQIQEIGPVMTNSIVNFFSLGQTRKLIDEFRKAGLNLRGEQMRKIKTAISGKTFVFTGELDNFSRDEARHLVESLGGNWSSSVSKATDFVVVGRNPGSKHKTAEELHLKVINEAEFRQLTQAKP